ncbi:hypothetical protein QBC35DRAFT_555265 [Podospora australis]|uniref:Uncharacterized protein n=1 Tax=Podospora australis TaxID=1536484 RepID=A0AAN7AEU6_9PEZI|nr:hypothetical protein QBC35DRAFT_555265 [Podospora australis]
MTQDNQSVPSEEWYVVEQVEDSAYSRSRSPQLNINNMSSAQVADASSEHNIVEPSISDPSGYDVAHHPGVVTQQPVSNGYTTDTGGTDDTQIKLDTLAAYNQGSTGVLATPAEYLRQVSNTSLTPSNIETLQYQLYLGNMSTWVDNAGIGRRLNRYIAPGRGSMSVSSARSALSTTSSAGQGWSFVFHPYPMEDDLAFAGDWSGEQLDQIRRASGSQNPRGQ